jgi:hypothetical protein
MAAEQCTRLHVLTAALKQRFHSNQPKAVQSTVGTVSRNTDDTRLVTETGSLSFSISSFVFDFFIFYFV